MAATTGSKYEMVLTSDGPYYDFEPMIEDIMK